MAVESLNLNNYALLPSIMTTARVQETTPVVGMDTGVQQTGFADFLASALGDTVSADYEHKATTIDAIAGGETDLHTIPIAAEKAELVLNLTVQVRNKMIEAYQEVLRMQI